MVNHYGLNELFTSQFLISVTHAEMLFSFCFQQSYI